MVLKLTANVAIVKIYEDVQDAFTKAVNLIGNIDDLNRVEKPVVIKVGIFHHKGPKISYPTVNLVQSIVTAFNKTPRIYLAESDNYQGIGSDRLQVWKKLFTERVIPYNLSDDTNLREVEIAGETIELSHILFKPNILISTMALRNNPNGTILKNLLGLIPDKEKARFHPKLVSTLLDTYEAVGGIDLAVLDATYTYNFPPTKKLHTNVLIVGSDAVAVETIGATLVGLEPENMPIIQEAINRGLGEGDIDKIKVLGIPIENLKDKFNL
jgi:uncharacterized protein (DUF362 family)